MVRCEWRAKSEGVTSRVRDGLLVRRKYCVHDSILQKSETQHHRFAKQGGCTLTENVS
jgi:hypothetical protein